MNEKTYDCDCGRLETLQVTERLGGGVVFLMHDSASNIPVARLLTPEDTADLVRDLAAHVGLTVEPEPFKRNAAFEDIRKGDLVRVEWTLRDVTQARTAVVTNRLPNGWHTAKGWGLHTMETDVNITILSRPETEPEPLPTTPGAVIKVWLGKVWGWTTLGADGQWRGAWPDGDDMYCTGDDLIAVRGPEWDRFEVVA